jgi:hypothetical protein
MSYKVTHKHTTSPPPPIPHLTHPSLNLTRHTAQSMLHPGGCGFVWPTPFSTPDLPDQGLLERVLETHKIFSIWIHINNTGTPPISIDCIFSNPNVKISCTFVRCLRVSFLKQ